MVYGDDRYYENLRPQPKSEAQRIADERNKELTEAYSILSRSDVPLKARKDALLTILVLDWGQEILARRKEFDAQRAAEQAERDRQAEEKLSAQKRMEQEMVARRLEQEEHERRMREDPSYSRQVTAEQGLLRRPV